MTFDPSDLDISKNDLDLLPRDPSLHPPIKFDGDRTIIWTFDPSDLDLDLCKGKKNGYHTTPFTKDYHPPTFHQNIQRKKAKKQ